MMRPPRSFFSTVEDEYFYLLLKTAPRTSLLNRNRCITIPACGDIAMIGKKKFHPWR